MWISVWFIVECACPRDVVLDASECLSALLLLLH
jgi:hypothetical protein